MTIKSCWSDDMESTEGNDIDSLTTMRGLQQVIPQPTHLLPSSLSWIDLTPNDRTNLAVEGVANFSLHPNCHRSLRNRTNFFTANVEKSIFNANYDGNFFESFSTMEQNKDNYEMKSLSYYKIFNLSLALLFKGKHIDPSYHSISKAHSTEADSSYRRNTDDLPSKT